MSHLRTPALPQLQVPWVKLSILRALCFTPHLVLGALCPLWSHPHPPQPHQRCALRPQSNTDCGFLLFSFSLWRDLIPEQPTLFCVMPAPHSMVPPLLATTLPCIPSMCFSIYFPYSSQAPYIQFITGLDVLWNLSKLVRK